MYDFLQLGQSLLFPNDNNDDLDDIIGGVSTDE